MNKYEYLKLLLEEESKSKFSNMEFDLTTIKQIKLLIDPLNKLKDIKINYNLFSILSNLHELEKIELEEFKDIKSCFPKSNDQDIEKIKEKTNRIITDLNLNSLQEIFPAVDLSYSINIKCKSEKINSEKQDMKSGSKIGKVDTYTTSSIDDLYFSNISVENILPKIYYTINNYMLSSLGDKNTNYELNIEYIGENSESDIIPIKVSIQSSEGEKLESKQFFCSISSSSRTSEYEDLDFESFDSTIDHLKDIKKNKIPNNANKPRISKCLEILIEKMEDYRNNFLKELINSNLTSLFKYSNDPEAILSKFKFLDVPQLYEKLAYEFKLPKVDFSDYRNTELSKIIGILSNESLDSLLNQSMALITNIKSYDNIGSDFEDEEESSNPLFNNELSDEQKKVNSQKSQDLNLAKRETSTVAISMERETTISKIIQGIFGLDILYTSTVKFARLHKENGLIYEEPKKAGDPNYYFKTPNTKWIDSIETYFK
jgi:hypothetical protein